LAQLIDKFLMYNMKWPTVMAKTCNVVVPSNSKYTTKNIVVFVTTYTYTI